MPITMSRINLIQGLGPALQIAEGWTVELPDEVHTILDERTNETWPTTWFVPRITGEGAFTDVYSVMSNWGANHGSFASGHIGSDLIALAAMLRIPVYMHNIEASNCFRPHVWAAFGTSDLESADYRACANYGPLLPSLSTLNKKTSPQNICESSAFFLHFTRNFFTQAAQLVSEGILRYLWQVQSW